MRHFLDKFGHFEPGDVIVHNDPYTGATHQGDGAIFRPMFYEDTLVGFSINRGHWTDIGGMARRRLVGHRQPRRPGGAAASCHQALSGRRA